MSETNDCQQTQTQMQMQMQTSKDSCYLHEFDSTFPQNPGVDGSEVTSLGRQLLRGIYSIGFSKPTEVQQRSIIALATGRDCIIQAQSGTGKTGAFSIGSLYRVDPQKKSVQLLVLSPTISLARQTSEVLKNLGRYMFSGNDDWLLCCYGGGTPFEQEIRLLRQGNVRVITGTTGRIAHLMREGGFGTQLRTIIFDEADNLLEDRFMGEIKDILFQVPKDVQVGLFSATMSDGSLENARKLVRKDPPHLEILLERECVSLAGIRQYKILIDSADPDNIKLAVLMELYQHYSVARCIIFTNSRKRAEWLGQALKAKGYSVSILHGDLPRDERAYVETSFRNGDSRIMVSSDLLSRGFDIQDLSLMINFDIPGGNMGLETYIHRIGRTGRYGRKGLALSLVRAQSQSEIGLLEEVNKTYGGTIEDLPANVDEVFSDVLCP